MIFQPPFTDGGALVQSLISGDDPVDPEKAAMAGSEPSLPVL